jgi:hypothetical protein
MDEMGRTFGTGRGQAGFCCNKFRIRNNLEDNGIDGRILLKLLSSKCHESMQ